MTNLDLLLKGAFWVAGVSLAVNSWFIKERVTEIATDLKSFGVAINALQLNAAIAQEQLTFVKVAISRHDERLSALERLPFRTEIKPGR